MLVKIATNIATVFGIGFYTTMPGTLGSGVAAFVSAIIPVPVWVILITTVVGIWASNVAAPIVGEIMTQMGKSPKSGDPGSIIIDEVVGMWLSVLFLPRDFVIPAFFVFRLVDIIKPFPVWTAERLPGGWGIMADDVVGGILVNIFLTGLYAYFRHAGWVYAIYVYFVH